MQDALSLVRKHHLFAGLSDEDLTKLDLNVYRKKVDAGEELVSEGDLGCDLFIIEQGEVEVLRSGDGTNHLHRIATLGTGANFGELALLDNGPRSATVRATRPTDLIVIDTGKLGHPDAVLRREHANIFQNLSRALSQRLRGTNNVTVAALERELELAELRVDMANFCAAIILVLCGYGFVIRMAAEQSIGMVSTTVLTVPLLLVFSAIVLFLMRRSRHPWSVYGVTTKDWGKHVVEAFWWTLPILALATAIKWVLIRSVPESANTALFDFQASVRGGGENAAMLALAMGCLYALVVPLQELTTRGALQSSLQLFLTGPNRVWLAILTSNVVFTACHLHLSVGFAVLAFFPGLVWGALYARQGSLVGVSFSHILVGVWALFVLGIEAVLPM
jgi:CRP-like cAMP-binding protein